MLPRADVRVPACRLVDGHRSSRLPALQGFSYPPNLLKPDASAACSSSVDLTHLSPLYWHRDFQDALGLWNHVELRSQSAQKSARTKTLTLRFHQRQICLGGTFGNC